MKKLFLNNAVIRDINLNDHEIAVYIALRSLYDPQKRYSMLLIIQLHLNCIIICRFQEDV